MFTDTKHLPNVSRTAGSPIALHKVNPGEVAWA